MQCSSTAGRHGVPVITSDRSSLPEVAGTAALLVDPLDTGAIAAAIAAPPARTSLPVGWSKLKLSEEQKQKVSEIKTKAADKVKELQAQIAAVKEKALEEEIALLTEGQKQQLADQVAAKAGLKKPPMPAKP